MSEITSRQAELAIELKRSDLIKFGEFELTGGRKSPIYYELRDLVSFPYLMDNVADIYSQMLDEASYDRLLGIPEAGKPLAATIAHKRQEPYIYLQPTTKQHGNKKQIQGRYNPGEVIAV